MWEIKGSGDLAALEKVAHRYGPGQDDETIRACLADLQEIRDDLQRRAAEIKRIAKQSPESCPDNKTSRKLANLPNLGLHPLVVAIDEVQNLYSHEVFGKDAEKVALDIIRLGRALGVDLPAGDGRLLQQRDPWCRHVRRRGAGHLLHQEDRGVGYLVGVFDDPIVAKSYHIAGPEADRIAVRALVGGGAGEEPHPTRGRDQAAVPQRVGRGAHQPPRRRTEAAGGGHRSPQRGHRDPATRSRTACYP